MPEQTEAYAEPIDTTNDQLACLDGAGRVSMLMPKIVMTREEALRHAAWLVALADHDGRFADILRAVRNT